MMETEFTLERERSGWGDIGAVFRAHRGFFTERGVQTEADLERALSFVKGFDHRDTLAMRMTDAFSVNFFTQVVSGYALRVRRSAPTDAYYRKGQTRNFVFAVTSVPVPPSTIDSYEVLGVVKALQKEGLWEDDEVEVPGHANNKRVFFFTTMGGSTVTPALYIKAGFAPSMLLAHARTAEVAVNRTAAVDATTKARLADVAEAFFGSQDNQTLFYHATDSFHVVGRDFWFCSDCAPVDTRASKFGVFDNYNQALSVFVPSGRSFLTAAQALTTPVPRASDTDVRFIAFETPIADARTDDFVRDLRGSVARMKEGDRPVVEHVPSYADSHDLLFDNSVLYRSMDAKSVDTTRLTAVLVTPFQLVVTLPMVSGETETISHIYSRARFNTRLDLADTTIDTGDMDRVIEAFTIMKTAGMKFDDVKIRSGGDGGKEMLVPTKVIIDTFAAPDA